MSEKRPSTTERTGLDAATAHLGSVDAHVNRTIEIQQRSLPYLQLALDIESETSIQLTGYRIFRNDEVDSSDMVRRTLLIRTEDWQEEKPKSIAYKVIISNATFTVAAYSMEEGEAISAQTIRSDNWVTVTDPNEERTIFVNAIYLLADKISEGNKLPIEDIKSLIEL